MAEVAEERPIDCYTMYSRSAKPGFALLTLFTVWSTGTIELQDEFAIATDSLLAEIRSNAPADWSAEEINQDVEEVYGIRIDMMRHLYPATGAAGAADASGGGDAPATTVRALIPPIRRPRNQPRTCQTDRCAEPPAGPRPGALALSASGRDSPPCFWAGRPRRRNEELREAGRAHSNSVSGRGDHESPEACRA